MYDYDAKKPSTANFKLLQIFCSLFSFFIAGGNILYFWLTNDPVLKNSSSHDIFLILYTVIGGINFLIFFSIFCRKIFKIKKRTNRLDIVGDCLKLSIILEYIVVLAATAILATIVDTNLWFSPEGHTVFSLQDKLIFNISVGLIFLLNLFALIKYITKKIYNKESKKHIHN
ncbi:MAG: hypothetical protein LBV48_00905 [Mycoplasmataceae bacterium]|nr:hypothetical protein [Mycoplasmataceae bacterium]